MKLIFSVHDETAYCYTVSDHFYKLILENDDEFNALQKVDLQDMEEECMMPNNSYIIFDLQQIAREST